MSSDFSVQGLAELEKFLSEFPEKLQIKVARNAMAAGARVIREEARMIVPVKSGALRQSIRVSSGRAKDGMITASIRAGGKNKKGDAFYAHMVEYGTQPHIIKAKKGSGLKIGSGFSMIVNHPGARPKPFMRPALDAKAQDAVEAVAKRMRERLDDIKT